MRRTRMAVILGVTAALVASASPVGVLAGSLTEEVAGTVAAAAPDPDTGWLPVDLVRHPLNPVYTMHPYDGEDVSAASLDRQFPTVMRVDDKIAAPLDGHRWYLWVWRHGRAPRTPTNGGRMILLTAPSLEGPWTDRGFVSPQRAIAGNPFSWTGGDVVWSPRYQRFFATPKSDGGTYLVESVDGVNWTLSDTTQPVMENGPEWYDKQEAGYGRLLRFPAADGAERWMYVYRANEAPAPNRERRLAVAVAEDILGPWEKLADNPLYHFFLFSLPDETGIKFPEGIDITPRCYGGYYQVLWQSNLSTLHLTRSKDLRNWEDLGGTTTEEGEHLPAPIFSTHGPHSANSPGGTFIWDDVVGTWTYLWLGTDYSNPTRHANAPVLSSVSIARSLTGGIPPNAIDGADCPPNPPFREPTSLTVAAPAHVTHTDPAELSATLTSDGAPLAGHEVELAAGTSSVTATTDENGVARGSVVIDADPGPITITATYAGNRSYKRSTDSRMSEVHPESTTLTYVGDTRGQGSTVRTAAVLTEDDGPALAGREVVFSIGGEQRSAVTDSSGRAEAVFEVADHGRSQHVTARFAGETRFEEASTKATVTWGAP